MTDRFISYLLQYGKTDRKTSEKGPLAVRTVRSIKSILLSVFNQAAIDGLAESIPVSLVTVHGKKNRDFQKDILRIQHTVVRVRTTEAKDSAKTVNSFQTLALFPASEQCLAWIKAEKDANQEFFGNAYHDSSYIFTWEDGTPYDPDYISKLLCKATKAYGRPEITLHKLRHTCASLLNNKGWDIKKLQYWLGHSDTSTTLNIYSHINKERMNEISDDLEQLSESCINLFQ